MSNVKEHGYVLPQKKFKQQKSPAVAKHGFCETICERYVAEAPPEVKYLTSTIIWSSSGGSTMTNDVTTQSRFASNRWWWHSRGTPQQRCVEGRPLQNLHFEYRDSILGHERFIIPFITKRGQYKRLAILIHWVVTRSKPVCSMPAVQNSSWF